MEELRLEDLLTPQENAGLDLFLRLVEFYRAETDDYVDANAENFAVRMMNLVKYEVKKEIKEQEKNAIHN